MDLEALIKLLEKGPSPTRPPSTTQKTLPKYLFDILNAHSTKPPGEDRITTIEPMNEEETRELKQSAATIVISTLAVLLILIVILIVLWMVVKKMKLRRERTREEDVRPTNYYTNDELYQRPMTAAENRIIRTLSKGPVDMANTYETMSKNPLYVQDEDIYGVPPANAGKGTVIPVHMPVRARELITENPIHEKTDVSSESETSDSITIYSSSSGYTTTEIPEKLSKKLNLDDLR
ncbi:Oidioi.mRNA.OKI2018_I69.chr2.g4480.t1.cds [Oikopleura dioica]|uniref:Oidioi.mRNA.OKI2018_I69.chr2.g4480.t1.cds n=1 Tax=Oikopleura dioica TaxID=34765 RepID=A0ABN7SXF9_OIKDI|nr:Oidioi.mRNA.OKI2018_I69.chr2.g4480.t1.cds [Oikopleura dioica]